MLLATTFPSWRLVAGCGGTTAAAAKRRQAGALQSVSVAAPPRKVATISFKPFPPCREDESKGRALPTPPRHWQRYRRLIARAREGRVDGQNPNRQSRRN